MSKMIKTKQIQPRNTKLCIILGDEVNDDGKLKIAELNTVIEYEGLNRKKRGKSPKAISSLFHQDKLYNNIDYTVNEFAQFVSIDSNTKILNGINVTVGVIIVWELINNANLISYSPIFAASQLFTDTEKGLKVENKMWGDLLYCDFINANKKTAVIVDSDFDNLGKYNKGSFFSDESKLNYLPKNFQFVYDSTDVRGAIYNELIKHNDYLAKQIISDLEKEKCNSEKDIGDTFKKNQEKYSEKLLNVFKPRLSL